MRKNLRRWHKNKAHGRIFVAFIAVLSGFFLLTMMNEVLDIPYFLLGDAPTSLEQRKGEVILEMIIYAVAIFTVFYYYHRFRKRIIILEGMLSICSSCKKIRKGQDWVVLEEYIHSQQSHADLTHGLCPECIQKLYPEYANEIILEMKTKGIG
jgi:hypothetical protein